jgi:heat shock protein HslJ/membrane-bound inhibitor of C-type lysozyme
MQHRVVAPKPRAAAGAIATAVAATSLALAGCAALSLDGEDEPAAGAKADSAAPGAAPAAASAGSHGATTPATEIPDGTEATPPLVGTTWYWLWTLDPERTWAPADHSRYTLTLGADGRLALRADCNRGAAGYRLDGLRLDVQSIGTTKMACPAGGLGDRFVKQVQVARHAVAVVGLLRVDLFADSGTMWFASEPEARYAGYTCADGRNAIAVYTPNRARLVIGPDTLDLRSDVSASGARYTDGSTEWFTKGDEAILSRDGAQVLSGCRRGAIAP